MEQLLIHTDRLLLRNLKESDLENFFIYRSNPEVTKYQGFDVMSKDECIVFIKSQTHKLFGNLGEWVQYGIEEKSSGNLIGDFAIKLNENNGQLADIGITISHLYQQKGFAKECLTTLVNWLFNSHNIHRITETVDAENIASIKLLQSVGFKQEGHFVENIFFKGKWGSEYQFALLKRDWK